MKPVEPTRSTSVLGAFARSAPAEPPLLPQPAKQNTATTNATYNDFNLPSRLFHNRQSPRGRTRQVPFCREPRQILGPIHVVPQIAALHTQPTGARGTLGLFQGIRRRPRHPRKHIRMNAPARNRIISAILTW